MPPHHEPNGFCPTCDYPMDPGTCPECGRQVTQETLVTDPRSIRRRARRRGTALVLASIVIIGSATWTYLRPDVWLAHVPTAWLLAVQGDGTDRASRELGRRIVAGGLDTRRSAQPIQRAFPIRLELPPSIPGGARIELCPDIGSKMFSPLEYQIRFRGTDMRALIDGSPTFVTFFGGRMELLMSQATRGPHTIEIHIDAAVELVDRAGRLLPAFGATLVGRSRLNI